MFVLKTHQIFFLFTYIFTFSQSVELSCTYKSNTDWWAIDNVYFCEQNTDVEINKSDLDVTAVQGHHKGKYTNDDVKGFRIEKLRLRYFPRKLEGFHPNLEFIAVWEARLKEIHQIDLKPFTKLRILSLFGNNIEVLERNLFQYNPLLEYIGLGVNKIRIVNGKIFNHLNNLHTLHFDNNVCLSRQVMNDKHEVWDLTEEIEENCVPRG